MPGTEPSTALFAMECQSFLDNLIAVFCPLNRHLAVRILAPQPASAVSGNRAAENARSARQWRAFSILFVSADGVIEPPNYIFSGKSLRNHWLRRQPKIAGQIGTFSGTHSHQSIAAC